MKQEDFESQYQQYEQAFMQKARERFLVQPSTNKVQFLRGVYRYLLLNRLFARKKHTVWSVLQDRYHDKLRSSECTWKIISRYASKLMVHIGSDMFEQMRIDAVRTLYDMFPEETKKKTNKKWGQYVASAVEWIDITQHSKFGLTNIRKNMITEYAQENWIPVRDYKEAQKVLAPRMREIKKKQAENK